MDPVTHALLGATVARGLPARVVPAIPATHLGWIGAVAAVFPDVDHLGFWIDPLRYLADWHRGPTHSLVLLPLWSALLALPLSRATGAPWPITAAVVAAALLSHVASDLLTAYGVAVLYPLSAWRPGLAVTFVVDGVFTAALVMGLLVERRHRGRGCRLALLCLAVYLAAQAGLKHSASRIAEQRADAAGVPATDVRALPMPPLPGFWKLVAVGPAGHQEAHLTFWPSLQRWLETLPPARPLVAPYRPANALRWRRFDHPAHTPGAAVAEAWRQPAMGAFRRFADLPAVHPGPDSGRCVWFTDRRYALPGLEPAFRYGMCRPDPGSRWQLYRLRLFSADARQAL